MARKCPKCGGTGILIKGASQDVWCAACKGTGKA